MKVKRNSYYDPMDDMSISRVSYPVNGFMKGDVDEYHNLSANMAKFKQIEVLSGSVKFYFMPAEIIPVNDEFAAYYNTSYHMMGYHTRRRWVDQDLNLQSEIIIPKPENVNNMWNISAEIPGYGVRFIPTLYTTGKLKKYAFKGNKKDWRTLKANPTSWQQNLPLPSTDPVDTVYPKNVKFVDLDIGEIRTGVTGLNAYGSHLRIFVTQTLLVRFKGRLDL